MPVMNNSLISNGGAFGSSPTSPIANVQDGGQLGFGPNLPNLDANTPSVYLPLQLVVMHAPTFLDYVPNGTATFKALFETCLVSMEGLDFAYSMEVDGTPVGRDGQLQNVPTRQVRSQISPSALFPEKVGNLVWNLGRMWMNMMHDPDTQAASMAGVVPVGTVLPPMVASMYSADLMFIQYDTTYQPQNIIDAFAVTNFFPTELGSPGYELNVETAKRVDRNFTFTCIVQNNNNTIAAAKSLATVNNLHQINYQDATPLAQSIEAQLANEGQAYLTAQYLNNFQNLDGQISQPTANSSIG